MKNNNIKCPSCGSEKIEYSQNVIVSEYMVIKCIDHVFDCGSFIFETSKICRSNKCLEKEKLLKPYIKGFEKAADEFMKYFGNLFGERK